MTPHPYRTLTDADLDRLLALGLAQRGHEIGTVIGIMPGELAALVLEVKAGRAK
jgi:hypothetical protein